MSVRTRQLARPSAGWSRATLRSSLARPKTGNKGTAFGVCCRDQTDEGVKAKKKLKLATHHSTFEAVRSRRDTQYLYGLQCAETSPSTVRSTIPREVPMSEEETEPPIARSLIIPARLGKWRPLERPPGTGSGNKGRVFQGPFSRDKATLW